jgi:hypothetical protein
MSITYLFSTIIIFYLSFVNATFKLRHLTYATGIEGSHHQRHLTYATGMEGSHYLRHLSNINNEDYNTEENFIDIYDNNY